MGRSIREAHGIIRQLEEYTRFRFFTGFKLKRIIHHRIGAKWSLPLTA